MLTPRRNATSLPDARVVDLPGNPEGDRQITYLELDGAAPFVVRRVYWVHSLADGEVRGYHAHRETQQLIVAAGGAFRIELDDGTDKREFLLDSPTRALWVPPGLWRMIHTLAPASVLLVMASSPYDEADYIRDYDAFRAYASGTGR